MDITLHPCSNLNRAFASSLRYLECISLECFLESAPKPHEFTSLSLQSDPLLLSLEIISNIDMELLCLNNMIYEYATEFADAFADTSRKLLPSHHKVLEMQQIEKFEDLRGRQIARLQENGTLHEAFQAHSKMTELKARKTIFENTRAFHQAFVDSRNSQN